MPRVYKVVVRQGTCYLTDPLVLTDRDSGVSWTSLVNETAVLSGGAPVSGLSWTTFTGEILVATLPEAVNASAVDQLYSVDVGAGGPAGNGSRRLVRARYVHLLFLNAFLFSCSGAWGVTHYVRVMTA